MLIDQLRQDLKTAMKEKDVAKKSVVQLLMSAIRKKEIDEKIVVTPDDEAVIVSKELKQTEEALEMIEKSAAGHEAAIEETKKKIEIIKSYLPKQFSEEELTQIISEEIKGLNITDASPKSKGLVMKNIMPKLKGKADGKLIDKVVSELLNK